MKRGQDGLVLPVIAGLVVGVAFVSAFALFVPFMLWPPNPDIFESNDKGIIISFSRHEPPLPDANYVPISKERFADHPVMLNGIRNARIMHEDCFGPISLQIVCQGPPFISTSAHAKVSVEQARTLVSEYGFRDLCSNDGAYTAGCDMPYSNYRLRVQYQGEYYGIGISGLPR